MVCVCPEQPLSSWAWCRLGMVLWVLLVCAGGLEQLWQMTLALSADSTAFLLSGVCLLLGPFPRFFSSAVFWQLLLHLPPLVSAESSCTASASVGGVSPVPTPKLLPCSHFCPAGAPFAKMFGTLHLAAAGSAMTGPRAFVCGYL